MIAHGFPPECSGGTEFYVLRLCQELRERGNTVTVLSGSHAAAPPGTWKPIMDRSEHDGFPIYRVHRTGLYVDNWERSLAPEVEECLQTVLAAERPDLVHVHHWIRLTRTLIETCHRAGIPAVCTLHDLWTTCPIAFRVRDGTFCTRPVGGDSCLGCAPAHPYMAEDEVTEELDLFRDDHRNEVQLARRIIVPSNAHRDALLPHLPDSRGRFRVVPHGNLSLVQPRSGTPGSFPKDETLHIAHWGHLTTFKGIDILLQACRGLDATRHKVHLHLFGNVVYPGEQEPIAKLAEGLNITWHGAYEPRDLCGVPMDLAVIPSRCSESWSFVLDEALLLGVPVAVPNRGALSERVGRCGPVFTADDPESLRQVIEDIFRDPSQLAAWREAERILSTMADHTERLMTVYREVLTSKAPLPITPTELQQRRLRQRATQVERRYRSLMNAEGLSKYQQGRIAQLSTELDAQVAAQEESDQRHAARVRALEERLAANDHFEALVTSHEETIQSLKKSINAREHEISGIKQLTAAREQQIRRLRQQRDDLEARSRDVAIERSSLARLGHMDRMMAEFEQVHQDFEQLAKDLGPEKVQLVLKGEAFLESMGKEVRETSREIASLHQLLAAKEAQISFLHGELADSRREKRDLLDNLNHESERTSDLIAREQALLRERDERDQIIAARNALIDERESLITELSHGTDRLLTLLQERERRRSDEATTTKGDAPLRILFVVHQFLPAHVAGTEIYTHALARALSERHKVTVLTAESDHSAERFTERRLKVDGLDVHQVIHNYKFDSFLDTYDCPRADAIFRRILKTEQPDVVHIQHLHYWSANFVTIAKKLGIPVVYTLHDYMLLCPKDGTLRRDDGELCLGPVPSKCADCIAHHDVSQAHPPAIPRALHASSDALLTAKAATAVRTRRALLPATANDHEIAVAARLDYLKQVLRDVSLFLSPSHFLKERFVSAGLVYADRVLVSDNGYDTGRLPKHRARVPGKEFRVGFVGTLAEHKGAHVLVEAMNGIEDPRVRCQIWGEVRHFPKYVQRLRDLSENPRTHIMGAFAPNQLTEVLGRLDVLVIPSLWFENSPLTVHEAAAAGVPVLASNHGGLAEFVKPEVQGRLFPPGDATALRGQILAMLNSPLPVPRGALEIKDIADDARAMEGHYHRVLARRDLHRG